MPKSDSSAGVFFIFWIITSIILCFSAALPAQNGFSPSGAPFIRNYPPDEYGAHNQNWAIAQDRRGVMYFGNSRGLLEYDGASWRLIQPEHVRIIRSMAASADGRIFGGGYGEIGYLAPDSSRQLQFVSLLPHLDEAYRDFTDVWQTLATSEGIFFVTTRYIFRWDGQKMRAWPAKTAFHFGFAVHDQFYVQQSETGLMQIVSDSLRLAPLGEQWREERISAMLPFSSQGNKRILVATRENGLFLYDDLSIERFATGADELLINSQVSCALALANGQFAFGTMQAGVVVIDETGKLRDRLHKPTGLQDDAVLSLYEDRQRALWTGLQVGIARAETGSPFRYFGEREGIKGSVWEIVRHQGRLYFATVMGVFYLDENSGRFKPVAGVSPQCWALLPFGKTLLASAFDGVYEINGNQGRRISDGFVFSLHRSRQDPMRVFAGMRDGLKSLYFDGGTWREEGRIEGMNQEVRHFYETPEGQLWLTDYFSGLLLVDLSKGYTPRPPIMRFDTLHGLPPADRVVAFPTDKGLRFATLQGIFLFDEARQRFYRDSTLVEGLSNPKIGLFSASWDEDGNLWLLADDNAQSGVARRRSEGVYSWDQSPFLRIAELPVFTAYPDSALEQTTWIGGTDQVVRYDGALPQHQKLSFPTLIRQVIANADSILYGGAGMAPPGMLELPFAQNSLRFGYSAPSFDDESKNEYQYLLEGYDEDWSNWTVEIYKDYTGLPPGSYRFLVRARNIYGQLGETAACDFQVLPPFYRTWGAYLLYALLLAGGVYQLWRLGLRSIQKKHRQEMEQLEFEKLKELDQMKSRFFADISHEFRTPLTLILGPVDNLLSTQPEAEQAKQFNLIKRNAQRLLRLINQLLDLSKLEAGKMKLDLRFENMIPLLRGITFSFESLVEGKNIGLRFESELEIAFLYFDRDKMEQVLTNLLSNAVKFTPEGGEVSVEVKTAEEGEWLQIEVADTGPGIPARQLPHVFDRFYQGDEALRIEEAGSGIGLALTKELVELHQGRVSASSVEGHGARFRILLPYGKGQPLIPATVDDELALENTLLLVEDNPDMRAFIRDAFAGSFRVLEAADGQEGVDMALEHIPDIIISDVMMPRKDGMELCEILKNDERSSHIPIILLTAKAGVESRLAGLSRGADDYLSKPFNREELLIRSRNVLEWRQRLRDRYASLQPPAPVEDKSIQVEDAFLQKIRGIVDQHLSDSDFEIEQLARVVGMSRSQMFRKIKALTGQSPSLFIRAIRLHRGKELLETTQMNVSEVAYEVGFTTPAYFSDAFTEAFGIRPSQLRK
ncbi:MAG: response regulator [Saprospirales bacterium]|nr:response regulator [Saprospirales bacterium]